MAGEATGGQQVADEALNVENDVVHTTYSHKNSIDVETGTYDVDCNGFVGFVLQEAAPEHLDQIKPESGHTLPARISISGISPSCPSTGPAIGPGPASRRREPRRYHRLEPDQGT